MTLKKFFKPWRWTLIFEHFVAMVTGSLPIISLATAFAGMVITAEIAYHMNLALHSFSMIPGFTGQFIFRELGIAIPALLIVSKVGASTTAEIGSMKITEQIDALQLLGIDPFEYLVFPRWIAGIGAVSVMTLFSIAITLFFAAVIAVSEFGFGWMEYVNALRFFIRPIDLVNAMIKGMVFGAVIPMISCFFGFECRGGAQGVGQATTLSVITSTITVITLDFLITLLLSS